MRRGSFRTSLIAALLCAAAPSFARQVDPAATPSTAIPDGFVAKGPFHWTLLQKDDPALGVISSLGAAAQVEDYLSFVLVVVDETKLGGKDALAALNLPLRDDLTLVEFNGFLLDGADPVATARALAPIPPALAQVPTPPADGESRLLVVQFIGPVKDDWLAALAATGAHVVTYAPNDAYVVKVDPGSYGAVTALQGLPFVLAVREYAPAFKLRPELRPPFLQDANRYAVTMQVVADAEGEAFASGLAARGLAILHAPNPVIGYWNVDLALSGAQVIELAKDPHVFAIEPILEARLLRYDESQCQIEAGNLNGAGSAPSAPSYFSWLASAGFPGSDPFAFAVDVTDDGIDKGNTTQVNNEFRVDGQAAGASRIAYANNYTSDALADGGAGHGNLNASIIGGYNALTGTSFEDANGYNYGLGIAPWVRLGNSKVFANSGAGVFNQPANVRLQNAWNGGARISSNSWGYTSGTNYNADTQLHDQLVRDAASGIAGNQEMTIVFAAGNDGPTGSTVHPPGTAKNIITAGASENWRMTGTDGCGFGNTAADNALDMTTFSSRGPTSDARKKPDVVAPGSHVEGAASQAAGYNGTGVCNKYWPAGQTLYAWSSGTSHSTPGIAGAAALVRQRAAILGEAAPSPAMVKACLVNGSTYLTGASANDTLWSNAQGMGRVNLGRTFDSAARIKVDQTQVLAATGATHVVSGNIASAALPFRVTLAWTDAPGPTTGNAYVNNLDLEVVVNGTLYRGNVFSGSGSIAGGTADPRNNVESVFLPAGTSGSFTVTVRATNIAGDGVPGNGDTTDQDFALAVYNGSAGVPSPDFSLSASPPSNTVTQGGAALYTISNSALNGFAGSIALSAGPAISGVSYSFSPNPMAAGGSSTLTVTTTAGATTGTQSLSITGTSGALVHSTPVSLTINPTGGGGGNPVKTLSAAPNLAIPDNDVNGVTSTINVADSLTVSSISVSTVIPHPYKGDLTVSLIGPDNTTAILHNKTGGSADNVTTTFSIATAAAQSLAVFNGKNTAGAWRLKVTDTGPADLGTLSSWSITFNGEQTVSPNLAIPDNNATGVTSTLTYANTGTVASVRVSCAITHTYKGDLVVSLIAPDGTTVILHNQAGGATDNVITEFPDLTAPAQSLAAFAGKSIAGAWKLKVQDVAAQDVGTLTNWRLSLTAQ